MTLDTNAYWERQWWDDKVVLDQHAEKYYLKFKERCKYCGFYLAEVPFLLCVRMQCLNITTEDPSLAVAPENLGKKDPALLEAEYSIYLSEMGELGTKPLTFSKWFAKREKEESK